MQKFLNLKDMENIKKMGIASMLKTFVEVNYEKLQEAFDEAKPGEKLRFVTQIMPYLCPKQTGKQKSEKVEDEPTQDSDDVIPQSIDNVETTEDYKASDDDCPGDGLSSINHYDKSNSKPKSNHKGFVVRKSIMPPAHKPFYKDLPFKRR